MREFQSFFKEAEGGEGRRCFHSTRLDTYGCGCAHDCSYCYAKSLLDFRGLWNPHDPAVADIAEIRKVLDKVKPGTILRLGGMTDCFQECERQYKVTYRTIKELNRRGIGYLIVTKSDLVASDEYMAILDKDLAHIQITVTCLDDELYRQKAYEKAPLPSKRIAAILKLQEAGYDVAVRLSPLMEEYMDFDKLNSLGIKKGLVEFLRINTWIVRWFDVDRKKYRIKDGGYRHLPVKEKVRIINKIKGMELSVCEDVGGHYNYWRYGFNPNPNDCCNLRKEANTDERNRKAEAHGNYTV